MIHLVVGGQYGGEGKGKISAALSRLVQYSLLCRTGGVNSSHTVHYEGEIFRLRMVPSAAILHRDVPIVYGAGTLIHVQTLLDELRRLGIPREQVAIDYRAGVITEECIHRQRLDRRYDELGSTLTGTGYGAADRAKRRLPLAREFQELRSCLTDVSSLIGNKIRQKENILVEGHQGTGLSNYHGDYPYCSSRDCIASEMLSELGVGPRVEMNIVMVLKLYPTRNHAGRLPNEMHVDVANALGIEEHGGGAWGIRDRRRRVGSLDYDDIARAIVLNTPSSIALTGLDFRFPKIKGARRADDLSEEMLSFVTSFESRVQVPVSILSTGPDVADTVVLNPRLSTKVDQGVSRVAS